MFFVYILDSEVINYNGEPYRSSFVLKEGDDHEFDGVSTSDILITPGEST